MSRAATDWAWGLDMKASQKILMLSLADRADEYHCCYPSIQRLVKDTGLDKKTIGKWIGELISIGLITDTGERKGPTKRVRVLKLSVGCEYTQKRDDTKNGSLNVPKNGSLNVPKNGSLNVPKNGSLNVPKNGSQNQSLEPTIESNTPLIPQGGKVKAKKFDPLDVELPEWLDHDTWKNWVEYRKEIKRPIKTMRTVTGMLKVLSESMAEGYKPQEIIDKSVSNGYQGLFKPNRGVRPTQDSGPHWNSVEAWREDFI